MWFEEGGIEKSRYIAWSGQEISTTKCFLVTYASKHKTTQKTLGGSHIIQAMNPLSLPKTSHELQVSSDRSELLFSALPIWNGCCLLKMKEEEKTNNSPNLKYFFPADTSFDCDKQNWASWSSLKQQHTGTSRTHTGWDVLEHPFPEFLMLGMLALDIENLGVHKVHHTESVYGEFKLYFTCRAASYSFSSFLHFLKKPPKNQPKQFLCDFCACKRWNIFTTYSTETFCQQRRISCLFTQEKEGRSEIIHSFLMFLCC